MAGGRGLGGRAFLLDGSLLTSLTYQEKTSVAVALPSSTVSVITTVREGRTRRRFLIRVALGQTIREATRATESAL